MRTGLARAVLVVGAAAGAALLAAPGQGQERPGIVGQARVFVENRLGRNEAVPMVLEEVAMRAPIGVQIVGTPTVAVSPAAVVQARLARQVWEYRVVTVTSTADVTGALSQAGADGWELTGITIPGVPGSMLLKRPR